ncbi:MAG: hypothetical protein PVH62_10325 [Anaerolineae bacterium]
MGTVLLWRWGVPVVNRPPTETEAQAFARYYGRMPAPWDEERPHPGRRTVMRRATAGGDGRERRQAEDAVERVLQGMDDILGSLLR